MPVREDGTKLIWGQTHCHTNLSSCHRRDDQSIDFNYRFFQDVMKSDFGCVTDHCFNQWQLERHLNHKIADYYYYPGQFVAFPAYEWTGTRCQHEGGPFGHANCLFLEEEGEMEFYSPIDPLSFGSSLLKLWDTYKDVRIVTIPHHTSDMKHTFNWDFYDAGKAVVTEVFQDFRGQHEQPAAWGSTAHSKTSKEQAWVVSALKRGHRLGLIGGGDHTGIARAGVEVEELTRTALYHGLMNRRAYASTEMEVEISFSANQEPVGSIVVCKEANFRLEILSATKIAEVALLKNGVVYEQHQIHAEQYTCEWKVLCDQNQFWYCRVLMENGEVIWTSPIWLEVL
jgi:hypothetical protein